MKYLVILLSLFCLKSFGQNLYLSISGSTERESKIIDSLGYQKKNGSEKKILLEVEQLQNKLVHIGYIENQLLEQEKKNDSVIEYKIYLNDLIKKCVIYIGRTKKDLFELENDTIQIAFSKLQVFLEEKKGELENQGYSQATINLTDIDIRENKLFANLEIKHNQIRKMNGIETKGEGKFPKGHLKNLERRFVSKTFTKKKLEELKKEVDQYEFVKQTKYPEVLFTKDSTKVFLYLEKKESNTFDGFVGFGNDESTRKLRFTGFLDLNLINIMKAGEKIGLNWRSDGKDQKTLATVLEIPYLLKTPFGIKSQLTIFRQDSLFQNTKIGLEIGYRVFIKSKLYLGYQTEASSTLNSANSITVSDYKNKFATGGFEYNANLKKQSFLKEKDMMSFKIGIGNRTIINRNELQLLGILNYKKNIVLDAKNNIEIRGQNYYLRSTKLIKNELFRYGGINSIRGFNENSLQANLLNSLQTEYQYQIAPTLNIHSILDIGYFEDKATNVSGRLLGLGFGLKILTKNGILNLIYANGSTNNQAVKVSNSIIHISLKTIF